MTRTFILLAMTAPSAIAAGHQRLRGPIGLGTRQRAQRLLFAASRITAICCFGLLPAVALALVLYPGLLSGQAWDFRVFYEAGRDYLHGVAPYPAATLAAVVHKNVFVYPAPAAAVMAPLAVLPFWLSAVLWTVLSVAAVVSALWLVGLRDWRCFGAVFLALPLLNAIRLGTVSPILMLLLAVLWRYRDRRYVAATATACLIVLKIFLWPLLIWLLVARRGKTVASAVTLAVAVTLVAWIPIGLASLQSYPSVLGALSRYEETFSFSPTTLAIVLGSSTGVAHAAAAFLGIALLAAVALTARRDESLSFRLAIAASFALTPIVWSHYWALLFVPLALTHPRLSPAWFVAMWIPTDSLFWTRGAAFWIAAALATAVIQLDLLPNVLGVERFGSRGLRTAVGGTAVVVFSIVAINHGDSGSLHGAALRPLAGQDAFAATQFRISPTDNRICWNVWSEHVPAPSVARAIFSKSGRSFALRPFSIRPDGTSRGCSTYGAQDGPRIASLAMFGSAYRLEMSVRGQDEILAGRLRG